MAFARLELNVSGVKAVDQAIEKYGKSAEAAIQSVLLVNAQQIAARAKSRAPYDTGKLSRSITGGKATKDQGPLAVRVYTRNRYAPYQEFGTGRGARSYVPTLPTEIQRIALRYRGNGGPNPNISPKKFIWNSVVDQQPLIVSSIRKQLEILDL